MFFFLSQGNDLWVLIHWGVICHQIKPPCYLKLQKWCYLQAMLLWKSLRPWSFYSGKISVYSIVHLQSSRLHFPPSLSVSGCECPYWLDQIKSEVTDRPLSVFTSDEARGDIFFCFMVALLSSLCHQAITRFLQPPPYMHLLIPFSHTAVS